MDAVLQYFDNRLNPLLLRELRQLVRNRFIIVLINLFVVVLVTACAMVVLLDEHPEQRGIGAGLFVGLTVIMCIACFFAVVVYTAMITATERINGDLMFTSALKPSSIVLGKFFSGALLTFLLMSITFPFVTLAYLLRGLDFEHMIITFLGVFMTIQLLNAFVIAVFSNVKTYVQMFVGLGIGLFAALFGFTGVAELLDRHFRLMSAFGSDEWFAFLSMFLAETALILLFLAAAVACISPFTSNRMFPIRLVVTAVYLLSLAYCGLSFWATGEIEFLDGWCGSWMFALVPLFFLAICERESWSFRMKKTIPRNVLLRIVCFPFYTGSPCGLVWVALLGAGLTAVFALATDRGFRSLSAGVDISIVYFGLFVLDYGISALLIRSFFLPTKVPPDKTWAVVLSLLLVFTLGSLILYGLTVNDGGLFDSSDGYSQHIFSAMNPFMMGAQYDQTNRIFASTAWAAIIALPFVVWFGMKIRRFSPTDPTDIMTIDDAIAIVKHADANPLVKGRREAAARP